MNELILKERKFKEDMVNVINNAGLPAFMLKPFIKELLEQLDVLEQKQYEEAKKEEEEKQKKEQEESKEEEE